MLENLLWAIFGVLSALVGVLVVYLKNSQKIIHLSSNKQKHNAELDNSSNK